MFVRDGDHVTARFGPGEAAVVHQVMVEVLALLTEDADRSDPLVRRMFPDVYPGDPDESEQYRRYTEDDLKTAKVDQAGVVLATLTPEGGVVRLDEEQADAWLRALTDGRLALGTRLDITDDTDLEAELDEAVLVDPTSPRVGQLSVYAYLSYLQESLVEALAGW